MKHSKAAQILGKTGSPHTGLRKKRVSKIVRSLGKKGFVSRFYSYRLEIVE
jgi:hypothetical protein